MTLAVVGAGAWGTTLACVAAQNTDVILYTRRSERAEDMQSTRINSQYLPDVNLPDPITVTAEESLVAQADHVIFAVPSIGFRDSITQFSFLSPDVPYVSVTKGLEQETNLRMSQVIAQADPRRSGAHTAVIGGPNLAHEIATAHPAATLVACRDNEIALSLQRVLMTQTFRVYTTDDVVGCEIGGVAKNVVAIAVGIGDGLGYGDNAKAAVMTRALAEITRLGVAEGGDKTTFSGLAGIGDLIATCASPLSRNRTVGFLLGQGRSLKEVQGTSHDIAEGVFSARALSSRAQSLNIDMPIVTAVAQVIETGVVSPDAVERLMTRPASRE